MAKIWQNYSLSIVLALLFLVSWLGQGLVQWQEFVQQAEAHSQPVEIHQFWPEFWASTLENWQSEFLQLFTFVVLTSFLSHKGSPESKDSDEEMKMMLKQIDRRLSPSR